MLAHNMRLRLFVLLGRRNLCSGNDLMPIANPACWCFVRHNLVPLRLSLYRTRRLSQQRQSVNVSPQPIPSKYKRKAPG